MWSHLKKKRPAAPKECLAAPRAPAAQAGGPQCASKRARHLVKIACGATKKLSSATQSAPAAHAGPRGAQLRLDRSACGARGGRGAWAGAGLGAGGGSGGWGGGGGGGWGLGVCGGGSRGGSRGGRRGRGRGQGRGLRRRGAEAEVGAVVRAGAGRGAAGAGAAGAGRGKGAAGSGAAGAGAGAGCCPTKAGAVDTKQGRRPRQTSLRHPLFSPSLIPPSAFLTQNNIVWAFSEIPFLTVN